MAGWSRRHHPLAPYSVRGSTPLKPSSANLEGIRTRRLECIGTAGMMRPPDRICPCGGIGRRGRLKICYSQGCGSSSLPGGTIDFNDFEAFTLRPSCGRDFLSYQVATNLQQKGFGSSARVHANPNSSTYRPALPVTGWLCTRGFAHIRERANFLPIVVGTPSQI